MKPLRTQNKNLCTKQHADTTFKLVQPHQTASNTTIYETHNENHHVPIYTRTTLPAPTKHISHANQKSITKHKPRKTHLDPQTTTSQATHNYTTSHSVPPHTIHNDESHIRTKAFIT
eukprot:gene2933-1915_t